MEVDPNFSFFDFLTYRVATLHALFRLNLDINLLGLVAVDCDEIWIGF